MSGGGEIIIRNGTWRQWREYVVVFGGTQNPDYQNIEGGVRVKGRTLLIAAGALMLIAGLIVGALVG